MSKIDYPKELTPASWEKHKGLLAKAKPTGIGKALDALMKMHTAVAWKKFVAAGQMSLASVDTALEEADKEYDQKLEAIAGHADSVKKLADKWAAEFGKSKLIPKSATDACKKVSTTAQKFAKDIKDFQGKYQADFEEERSTLQKKLKEMIVPMIDKNLTKIDRFLSDIKNLVSKPNRQNFDALALGDGGARGYCTSLQNWDQFIAKNFAAAKQVYGGKAMEAFFEPVKEYGANRNEGHWSNVLGKEAETGKKSVDDVIKDHATELNKQVSDIKKFKGYLESVKGLLA